MSTQCTTGPRLAEEPEWQTLDGEIVEMRRGKHLYRRGRVEASMPDGSGLWMQAEGPLGRELIWRAEGFTAHKASRHIGEVWPHPEDEVSFRPTFLKNSHMFGDRS
jgi:hypothetical protein